MTMAAGKRRAGESLGTYRGRLANEQYDIERAAKGTMIFQSTFLDRNGAKLSHGRSATRNPNRAAKEPHYINGVRFF
jgi:hypothetical protein